MIKKVFALVMVVGVLGVLLGGCGDKPADDANSTTPPAATAGDAAK